MEILQKLQTRVVSTISSTSGDNQSVEHVRLVSNQQLGEGAVVHDEITDHSLRELQCMTDESSITTKSSMADLILGSGDSLTSIQESHSLKNSNDLFAVSDSSKALTHNEAVTPADDSLTSPDIVEDSPQVNVNINNVVCTFSTRCHLNLRYLALNGENVEFKKAQGMLNMKLRKPSATASIWSSGKITVTGANSEDNCKIAARRIARKIQNLGFNVKFSSFRIVNVLGTCSLPFGILLTQFTNENIDKVQYEPELHPGATYHIKDIHATLKIFSTGSITITAPKVENIQLAVEHVFPLVYPFKKPKRIDPKEIRYIEEILDESSDEEILSDSDLDLEPGEIPTDRSRGYTVYKKPNGGMALPLRRRVPNARLPHTIIDVDDYGSSSEDNDHVDSDESMD